MFLFVFIVFYFFKDTATTESYTYGHTLSLHDALPIWCLPSSPSANCASKVALSFDSGMGGDSEVAGEGIVMDVWRGSGSNARYLRPAAERTKRHTDRKSTRLNSSH